MIATDALLADEPPARYRKLNDSWTSDASTVEGMPHPALVLSIHPEHCQRILRGEKTVEYRKQCPTQPGPLWAYLYETSPSSALVGVTQIARILAGPPEDVWRETKSTKSTTEERFFRYFDGRRQAVALILEQTRPLGRPLPLPELIDAVPGFRPPQSFMYVPGDEWAKLAGATDRSQMVARSPLILERCGLI